MIPETIEHSLSDEPLSLRDGWQSELFAILVYPDDLASARQLSLILADEQKRQANGMAPSSFISTITHPVARKSASQRTTAGLVAIAMVHLKHIGERPSLSNAAKVVAEFGGSGEEVVVLGYQGTDLKLSKGSIPADIKTVENYFRKYKSVAHLAAVACVAAEHYDWSSRLSLSECPEFSTCMLHSVLFYQDHLSRILGPDWKHWRISAFPPLEMQNYPPLAPSVEAMASLFTPWLEAMKVSGHALGRPPVS